MNSSRRVTAIGSFILFASLASSILLLQAIARLRMQAGFQQALYIRSAKVLHRLSLGYTGLLADIYWTRSVQYFGYQHHHGSEDFHLLAPLLRLTTELDPNLIPPYEFGANFLAEKPPNGAGAPAEALALLQYGIVHNPNNWRLYYNLGFLYFTELNDYAKATDAFTAGSKLPVTNEFMPILAARMAQHAGEFDTSRMLWYTTYQNSKDGAIRDNALKHLVALRVDEDVTHLEELVQKYREQTKRLPENMSDLGRIGFIHGTPVDPNGKPYRLTSEGQVLVQDPKSIPYITKGLPPDHSPHIDTPAGVKIPYSK